MGYPQHRYGFEALRQPATTARVADHEIHTHGAYLNTQKTAIWQRDTMRQSFRWHFCPAHDFASISDRWQKLCDASVKSPLLSSEFIAGCLQHFAKGEELVCIGEGTDGPIAATILQRRGRFLWETFQPSQMPIGPWMQAAGLNFDQVQASLLRALPKWAMMLGTTSIDPMFVPKPNTTTSVSLDSITTGEIDLPESFDGYMNSLDAKHVAGMYRRLRKTEREIGAVTRTTKTDVVDVEDFVQLYADLESRGWKGRVGTALKPGDHQSAFYADLLKSFAAKGQAKMFVLRFDSRPVAAQIAIASGTRMYLLKTTFDPDFRNLGPGVLLHHQVTTHCFEEPRKYRRIELYGPLNDSQKMWITGKRVIFHVNSYRSSAVAKLHRHLIGLKRQKASVETTPASGK